MKALKSQVFCMLLFLCLTSLHSYTLTGRWLETRNTSNPYNIHISTEMSNSLNDSLENEWIRFNIDSCLLNWHTTDSIPSMVKGTVNDSGTPILKYLDLNDPDNYGNTAIPVQSGDMYSYDTFTTTINKNTRFPWYYLGGGHYQIVKDSLMIGGVDINTIFRHEIGHSLIFDHDYLSELDPNFLTLMSDGTVQKDHNFEVLSVGSQEIAGLSVIYEPPQLNANTTTITFGDSIQFTSEGSICYPATGLTYSFNGYMQYPNEASYNSTIETPVTEWEIDENTNKWGAEFSYKPDRLGIFNYKVYAAMFWNSAGDLQLYETNNRPYSEVSFKVVAAPEIQSPLPNEIYHVRPSGGKGVTDTLAIKVKVPEILGSYPDINIKIDDVYVNPGDITFDSEENVWVYNWDLSAEAPTQYGKRYSIKAEIDGDPTDYDLSSVYLVEAIFFEDFQTIADFASADWTVETFIYPVAPPYGWKLGLDLITAETGTRCAKSIYTYSLSFYDMLRTPAITIPSDPNIVTKLTYRLAYKKGSTAVNLSKLYFNIYDENDNQITFNPALATVASSWIDVEYDLSSYAGQTIKLNWKHHYASTTTYCENTQFAIDDVKVFQIPDMDSPNIDFIAGNVADLNEDMNLTLQFNDNSGIESVTADYSIEEDSNTITLYPVKGTYNYTGVIPARDHECNGSISYKIIDSVGNETVSGDHGIYWALSGGGLLAAPENVIIATENDSTVSVSWDLVDGATGYKVYSSPDPYGTFTEDSTGTFTETSVLFHIE